MIDPAILALQNSIAKSKIARSQSLTDVERLRGGADLYDEGMRWLTLAIRGENPEFTPEQVDAEIERRKAIVRRIDENGLYKDCGMAETHDEE
ncbi:MAG: hypothetical protein O2856_08295 [Planctomycetota bacterium]|nr:hypothetical protein [Planctomycetota bacterium]